MDFKNSAIAIATDDGETVSSHFGRARFYEVLSFSDGKVIKRERRVTQCAYRTLHAFRPLAHPLGADNQ